MHPRTEYNRRWREKNKDRLKAEKAKYDLEHKEERKDYKVLQSIKDRAKKKGIAFDLDLSDILEYSVCPVFGYALERGDGCVKYNSPSVDRINPTQGYTKNNIQILSNKANSMKQDATPEELLKFAEWIFKTYKKENNEDSVHSRHTV
jgi:hypothetical protein